MPADAPDLTEQAVPDETACPYCGASPTDDSVVEHRLSMNGYLHDDIELECGDCGESWMCGVPIGDQDTRGADDLFCGSCDQHRFLVHRVQLVPTPTDTDADVMGALFRLHLKCPNCYHFTTTLREADHRTVALVGYPSITGDTEAATHAYGYPDGADGPTPPGPAGENGNIPHPDADDLADVPHDDP